MESIDKTQAFEGLYVTIPASAKTTKLSETMRLLEDKEELLLNLKENIHHLNREQLEYLQSLLHLETTVFQHEKLNGELIGYPEFFYVTRYNLFEGTLKTLKQMDDIDKSKISLKISVPERESLDIWGHTNILAFPLVEIGMWPQVTGVRASDVEIDIYESKGYTSELEKKLYEGYKAKGMNDTEISFRLKENEQKKEITKRVSNEILNYWNLSDFDENSMDDEKIQIKRLSWATITKHDIDD